MTFRTLIISRSPFPCRHQADSYLPASVADLVASATASSSPLKRAGLPGHAAPPGALPPHTVAVSTAAAAHTTAQLAAVAAQIPQNNPAFLQAFVHAAQQQQQQQQQHKQQQDLRRAAAVAAAAASPSPSQTPPAISVASSVAQDLAITRYNTAVSAAAAAQQQHRPVALARTQVRHRSHPCNDMRSSCATAECSYECCVIYLDRLSPLCPP